MRVLDLFCGEGGASQGLHDAGFEVEGVDIVHKVRYPYRLICCDALVVKLDGYDFYWASPPCQGYSKRVVSADSQYVRYSRGINTPRLIDAIRERLIETGKPYVIENVFGARYHMKNPVLLCGTMFGLPYKRHRLFEANFPIVPPKHPKCQGVALKYAKEKGIDRRDMVIAGKSRNEGCVKLWNDLLGVRHTMTAAGCAEAIPPAYSKFIAEECLKHIDRTAKIC